MSNLDIFKGNSLVNSDLFKSLMDMNKKMAGGTGAAGKRISLRGSKFRMMVDGEQVAIKKDDTLNVVIVNAGDISRTYYEGTYDPENPTAPTCWSADSKVPAAEVPDEQRQASRCNDCPMNVKGSGQGESRACRFSQRLAVALEGDLDTIYQLQVPAASLFGEARGSDMGLQAYVKFLSAHSTPAIAVMTELRFDENASTPKLFFRAVRGLDEQELQSVLDLRESEEAIKAITLTVAQTDGGKKAESDAAGTAPKGAKTTKTAKAAAKPEVKPADEDDEDDEDEIEEPKKVTKSGKAAPPPADDKLAAILKGWDD